LTAGEGRSVTGKETSSVGRIRRETRK